jgi:hypothetical protein
MQTLIIEDHVDETQSTADESAPVKVRPDEYRQMITTELSRDLKALKELQKMLGIRGDRRGVRIVSEWIRKKKDAIERFNLENHGGDV